MFGYAGKILTIDLSSGEIQESSLDEKLARKYLGGLGINTKLLFDNTKPNIDPLGPDNVLIFGTGPLVGTFMPTASKTDVSAKSPITGLFGATSSGYQFGSELKYAGYDHIIIKGRANRPVYLAIRNDSVEIRDADHLWGKDVWDTIDQLEKEWNSEDIKVAAIGPGGENLIRFSAIQNGKYDAWARTGMGAVMGSKRLKAIVVRGKGGIKVAKKEPFRQLALELRQEIMNSPFFQAVSKYGSMAATGPYGKFGALPVKNFQSGVIEDWFETRGYKVTELYSNRMMACPSCPIACAHWAVIKKGPYAGLEMKGIEVTPMFEIGAKLFVHDMDGVLKCVEVFHRFGVDVVSGCGTIAMLMELYQRKLIDEEKIGFPIPWGDVETICKLVEMIAKREGIGDMLAEGSKRANMELTGNDNYAITVKGLEIPTFDPRSRWSVWTFGFLTSTRGGDNLRNRSPVENLRFPSLPDDYRKEAFEFPEAFYKKIDMPEDVKKRIIDPDLKTADILLMEKWSEDLITVFNSIGICTRPPSLQTLGPTRVAKMFQTCVGWDMDAEEVIKAGERIWNLQRIYNLREGERRKDTVFPRRFYSEKLPDGPAKGMVIDKESVDRMLDDYYEARGWDRKEGIPLKEKIVELGLEKEWERVSL
ncbi:MAG: aldehyde ferredoxin oxidoreductase family protein [Deltaproteobacteria bacterium]|nr:aldehyde ferredoxin oxidoreductase family protein [Deltaproteobacteria bacterium]